MKRKRLTGILSFASLMAFNVGEAQLPAEAMRVETMVHDYYHDIKGYNVRAYRAMITPEFVMISNGVQLDGPAFEGYLREQEQRLGPAASRPDRFQYELVDFKTEITPDIAYVTFLERSLSGGNDFLNTLVLVRSGDQWIIDRFFHSVVETDKNP